MAIRKFSRAPIIGLALALALAACGGGDVDGGDTAAPTTEEAAGDGAAGGDTTADTGDEDGGEGVTGVLEGELITIELGVSPGGGYDSYARMIAPYLAEELNADVVVENVTGAGGLLSLNQVYNSPPDGTKITLINGAGVLGAVIGGAEGVEFDLADMTWIGRLAGEPRLITVGTHTPYETAEDLVGSDDPVTFAATGPTSGAGIVSALSIEALGLSNGDVVYGFDGSEESTLSVTAGELDAVANTLGTAMTNVNAGDHRPLILIGNERVEELPDVPTYGELDLEGEAAQIAAAMVAITEGGRLLAGPPGMPDEVINELRAAFENLVNNPELLEEAERQNLPIQWLDHTQVEQIIADALDAPPVVAEVLAEGEEE
ncbi:tripartite tricarboxylate transporter substrate-binding protein [Egicoccus sp. AB-alg2]|uniref:tripartite tricarboxylate transporter substrate-binding protein n=1 Tax=Egicoccus sp. AB-alg2 TaxID=3242693 RepID=UPI00359EA32A